MLNEKTTDVLNGLGDRWKGLIERAANLDGIKNEEYAKDVIEPLESMGWGYDDTGVLRKLLREYKGKKIEDVFDGGEVVVGGSACYQIQSRSLLELNVINRNTAKKRLMSSLKLIYGIGDATEERLKDLGYATIADLKGHPRYGHDAKRLLEVVEGGNINELRDWIGCRRRISASHPLSFYCSSFHDTSNLVLLDIETMGLAYDMPIILIGAAYIDGPDIIVNQYLVRDIAEEPAVLKMFLSHVNESSFLVTFNGKSFDVPFINNRMAFYGERVRLDLPHYDMRYYSRTAWRDRIPDCRLVTLERYLFNDVREDDIPSEFVPRFYEAYLRKKNIGPLVPIIQHNKQDLITLARLFARLHKEWK